MKRFFLIILICTAIPFTALQAQDLSESIIDSYDTDTLSNATDTTTILTSEEIPDFDYNMPRSYEIEEITISGKNNYDDYVLIGYSGLKKGERIDNTHF